MNSRKLFVASGQEQKIKKAVRRKKGCRLFVSLSPLPDSTEGEFLLRMRQIKKLEKHPSEKVALTLSREDVEKNLAHKGGFLPFLLPLIATIGGGAISAVVENEISKSYKGGEIAAPAEEADPYSPTILLAKKSGTHTITDVGDGLRLNPWKFRRPAGYGLFITPQPHKKGNAVHIQPHQLGSSWGDDAKKIISHLL